MGLLCLELCTTVGLPKGPTSWSNIVRDHSTAITGGNLEWEGLAIEVSVALPVLAPVSWHCLPTSSGPFDGHSMDITSTTNVCDQDKVKVRVAIDGEPYASLSTTGYPTKIKTQPEYMLLGNILQSYSTLNKW